ncbi:hypothetical protein BAUCODRAFT_99931 [Baudoinia panamericana UAMH 10762]|uniref:Uncharacterized protein n=1 Tax=Baudoinia panamericana (strain UAMH 10762) TaxID=717646 RepID=M2M0Q0_BAUPA|nr:uncharacterized protein BAUCODRAFT_99931 [Baudoinia panamericana UAMH 10762]EMD00583.1 hypothetical protein BAUCODRAFT_99931 [Baudoinia panamericana UAMH 10762]
MGAAVDASLKEDRVWRDDGRRSRGNLVEGVQTFIAVLAMVLTVAALGCTIMWEAYQISGSERTGRVAILDTSYRATSSDFDIVVNMYRENPDGVNNTLNRILRTIPHRSRIFVYTKDEQANIESLRSHFPTAIIAQGPNIGREGETYLHHVLTHWDDLGKHTMFIQAEVWEFESVLDRISRSFSARTGMQILGSVSEICDCHQCADAYWQDSAGFVPHFYELANNSGNITETKRGCGWLMLSYKGPFIASAARIRGSGRTVFEFLNDSIADPESWAHQRTTWESMRVGIDSMNAPSIGYSIERLWAGIMQCADWTLQRVALR